MIERSFVNPAGKIIGRETSLAGVVALRRANGVVSTLNIDH